MTAAHVTWRPLGALLVEKGLLTAEELEDALAAQQTTGKRLGQILVERGHVSGPALTNALAEQYGIELTTEEGFGTGLRAEIERRHSTRRPPAAAEEVVADAPHETPALIETNGGNGNGDVEHVVEHVPGDVPLAELEPQLEEQWARLVAAETDLAARESRIAELEAALAAARRETEDLVRRLQEVGTERDEARRSRELEPPTEDGSAEKLALETRAAELADRERELAELEQRLAGRQRAVLTAAADLEQRGKALEEREHVLPEAVERTEPRVPSRPERPEPPAGSGWSLDTLTRLVEERAEDFPDRADEWRYTLFYLRNEAEIDGTLPSRFDGLVDECFGELLDARPAAVALLR